jgi:hypothetical protein
MTRTLIGLDYLGIPCVKITKGNIDPVTEPDANAGSFLYNSKWMKDLKIQDIEKIPAATGNAYFPAGSTQANYKRATYTDFNSNIQIVRNTQFDGLSYQLPVFDMKMRRVADAHFVEQYRTRYVSGEDTAGREAGFYRTTLYGTWYLDLNVVQGTAGGPIDNFFGDAGNCLRPQVPTGHEGMCIVWALPANDTAILDSNPIAVTPGKKVVEITKDYCRVAKPGYDLGTATPTQLAFDSSRRPASVIKGGDINLPMGTTEFELGFAVTANMVCDMILYENGVINFPMSQYGSSLVAEYWFSGTKLIISNAVRACRARFLVMAFDDSAPSSGANNVLRQFNDGTQDVVQFLRPGSANPPNFSDIVLDSRWPALQILAEGYQTIAAQPNMTPPGSINTGQSFTVNFNSNGLFPFIKYMTVHQHVTNGLLTKPAATFITENYNNQTQYHQGNSSYCVLTNNQATFWTFRGNPELERTTGGMNWVFDYPPDPIIGIRYYILGIAI